MGTTGNSHEFEALLEYLRGNRSFDFTGYKRASLMRRVNKRMQTLEIEGYGNYIDYLEVHPDEFTALFNTILINVTSFFRDMQTWDYLATEIVPQILVDKPPEAPIRIWSAGCASGEEPYTLAMIMAEALGVEQMRQRVKIFATDVDEEALGQARQASYSPTSVASLPPVFLEKYFEQVGSHFSFDKELRRLVIFGRHDLVQDAPISRIDLLVCRNSLMYFNGDAQTKILERFHFALNQNKGFLLLGKAEMLFARTVLFLPINLKQRVFMKVPRLNLRDRLLAIKQSNQEEMVDDVLLDQAHLGEIAFNTDPIPQLVVDHTGVLVRANHRAYEIFNLTPYDLGRPLQDLVLSYRPIELCSPIEQVRNALSPLTVTDVEWSTHSGVHYLDVHFMPLLDANNLLLGIKISFTDISRYKQLQEELNHSKQELETACEELQSTNEELETTNEELQSTVEELETTNEELQSTNEELETMNEELQSANEELQAMNDELRERGKELNQANVFLGSILGSLRIGVVVVDQDLRVLVWNQRAEDLWGLRTDEVTGRHFFILDIGLPVDQIRPAMRLCLTGEARQSEVTLAATNRRGKTIQCQVKCTPLASLEQTVQGVILLMEEL
jgi:two-component system CheB/CheR fusion protein